MPQKSKTPAGTGASHDSFAGLSLHPSNPVSLQAQFLARTYKGQAYTVTGSFQRQRKDGTTATVLEWTSHCPECGAPFTFTTPAASAKFQPNRRCQTHKRPGHRVKGGGNA